MSILDEVKALAGDDDLLSFLQDQTRVWAGERSSHRWWDELLVVVKLSDGRLVGYYDARTTGDLTPDERGWRFDETSVCAVEAYEHAETRYRAVRS